MHNEINRLKLPNHLKKKYMKEFTNNQVDLTKKMLKHITRYSSFDSKIKQDMCLLFMQIPINSKGKMLFEYKILFNLEGKKLDGLLLSKLRSVGRRLSVNKEIISASLPTNVSFNNKMSDNHFQKYLKEKYLPNLYESGKYKGKAELNFMTNKYNIERLMGEIFKNNHNE